MGRLPIVAQLAMAPALVSLALSPLACADKDPSAIVVAITTDYSVPSELVSEEKADLTEIYFTAERNGNASQPILGNLSAQISGNQRNPATITIQADPDRDTPLDKEVKITLELSGPGRKITRTARVVFSEGKTKLLRMHIGAGCEQGDNLGCGDSKTCGANQCVENKIDVNTLDDYRDGLVFPEGDACFNNTVAGCFNGATTYTIQEIKALLASANEDLSAGESDCFLPLPRFASDDVERLDAHLNIALIWKALAPRFSVLNKEPSAVVAEGWALDRSSSPARIKLPKGLCKAVSEDRLSGAVIALNDACSPKVENVPLCKDPTFDSDSSKLARVDLCTVSGASIPAPKDPCAKCPMLPQAKAFSAALAECKSEPGCMIAAGCALKCNNANDSCASECLGSCGDASKAKAQSLLMSSAACTICNNK